MHWNSLISGMYYPHWMIVGGSVLVVVGFLGLIFQKNNPAVDAQAIIPSIQNESR